MNLQNSNIASYLASIENYIKSGDIASAESILSFVISLEPNNSRANELLAYIRGNQGSWEVAHNLLLISCQDKFCSAESNYYLGTSFLNRGEFEEAIENFQLSLDKGGNFFEGFLNLGIAKSSIGKKTEALELFFKALSLKSDSYILFFNMGKVFFELDNYINSIKYYNKSIRCNPTFSKTHYEKGIVFSYLYKFRKALLCFTNAIFYNPSYPEAYLNKGHVLSRLGLKFDALDYFKQAIRINPDYVKAFSEYGVTLIDINQCELAINILDQALLIDPLDFDSIINKGYALHLLHRYSEAISQYEYAIKVNPESSILWTNLGVSLTYLNNYDDALACFQKAIQFDSHNDVAWAQIGILFNYKSLHREALFYFQKAICINKNNGHAHFNLSYSYFQLFELSKAWTHFEWRWSVRNLPSQKLISNKPLWKGDKKKGVLYIWYEQGLGDQILFSSVFNFLKVFPQKIIISIPKKLIPLYSRSFPELHFIDYLNLAEIDYDEQIALGSVPKFFLNIISDFDLLDYPYLIPDKNKVNLLNIENIGNGKLNCGISFKSYNSEIGHSKSIPIDLLNPIFNIENINFINLQYELSKTNIDYDYNYPPHIKKFDSIDLYNDIDGVAAIIDSCDIIITISSTIAHLAGALNKTTLLILPLNRGKLWYWTERNGQSIWYPSIKIFNQISVNRWEEPIREVCSYLDILLKSSK